MTNFSVNIVEREIGNLQIIREIFFIEKGFLSRELIKEDLRQEEKVPMRRDRLTIKRIVGNISFIIYLRTVVGMGSR